MTDVLFTQAVRDEHPLAGYLEDWRRHVHERADGLQPGAFQTHDDEQLLALVLTGTQLDGPPLTVDGLPDPNPQPAEVTRTADGVATPYWRWPVRLPVSGNTDLLTYWPGELEAPPASANRQDHPAPEVFWEMHNGVPYAYFDVSKEDDVAGDFPAGRLVAAVAYLNSAVGAVNKQVAEAVVAVKAEVLDAIAKARVRHGDRAAQIAEAVELVKQELGEPIVKEGVEADQAPVVETAAGPVALTKIVGERTFRDLIATTRQWGAAASRYPAAFSALPEEAISGVLVATLNAVFDTAQREVFQNEGRTDIYVEAFRDDRENAAYFGEAKKWSARKRVADDVAQVLRQSNAATRDAMLLYYVTRKNFELIAKRARAGLEVSPHLVRWEQGDDGGEVAVVRHPDYGNEIRLTTVLVHLPSIGDEEPDEDDAEEAG